MEKLRCYIEEYQNKRVALCAQLRDKASNSRIVILSDPCRKRHLLRFMSVAKNHIDIMPTIFDRNETDSIVICSNLQYEEAENIIVSLDSSSARYLY